MLLQINGVDCPTPSTYDLEDYLISDANRNANGDMIIKLINKKRKLVLSWYYLKPDELKRLNDLLNSATTFNVRYFDDEINDFRTINCYRGDKKRKLNSFIGGVPVWTGISCNLIEV